MPLPDSGPREDDTNSLISSLLKNYDYLNKLYRRGGFEEEVDSEQFTFFDVGRGRLLSGREADRGTGRPGIPSHRRKGNAAPPPVKVAAEDLYDLARHVEAADPEAARESVVEVLRVKVLSFEIGDYFLDVPAGLAESCLNMAREVGEALEAFRGLGKPLGADPLVAYVERRYPFVTGLRRRRELIQQLILVALCGVSQMYREHHDQSSGEALPLAEGLRDYIENYLPKLTSPERVSLGLLGLTLYMIGRLKLSLNDYSADLDFVASAECYANRVQRKEAEYRHGNMSLEEYELTRLLTLRRSALVSAFGSGFLSLITSDLPSALKSIALARAIVQKNSGLVNSAYTNLLYCAVKRAQHSSDLDLLRELRCTLRRCLFVFRRYVPNHHYEHRAGIELALVHHYIAKADPRRARSCYALAERYLLGAIEFAGRANPAGAGGRRGPSQLGEGARSRNPRLLAEALTILSHVARYCLPGGPERVDRAIALAERAIEAARDSRLYACEARIAMGAACVSRAELFEEGSEERKRDLTNARVNFLQTLAYNKETKNPRVSAICYIRLGLICLSDKETFAEARHWHDRWVAIKRQVHHEFCHQMGQELERRVGKIGGLTYLLIDPERSIEYDYWQEQLDNFLKNQAIYRVIKELRVSSARGASGEDLPAPLDRKRLKMELVRFLREEVKLTRNKAYEWVNESGLETRIANLLRE